MVTSRFSMHSDGTTGKVKHWVGRIMKAYSAHYAHATRRKGNVVTLDSMMDRSTSSDLPGIPASQQPQPNGPGPENGQATKPQKFFLESVQRLLVLWPEREERRKRSLEDEKWLKLYDKMLADAMGDAQELYANNTHVATYTNDGSFRKKAFLSEQPELAEACMVYERVFSLDKLKELDPKAYAAYRARTMRVKDNPENP